VFKRTWIVILIALALGALLSACGSGKLAKDLTPIPTLPPGQTPTLVEALQGGAAPATEAVAQAGATEEAEGGPAATEAATSGAGDAASGEQLFVANCAGCHGATDGAGPALVGMAQRAPEHAADHGEGQTPEEYLHESIVDPGAYVVPNFQDIMPKTYRDQFSEQQLNGLVAYLMTQ
jgi:mono/diheme cytochrome c family protein